MWDEGGAYVQTDAAFSHAAMHEWSHGLGDVVTALLGVGLRLTMLEEHDCVPWDALPGQTDRVGEGEWRLRDRPWRPPRSYALRAVRPG